MYVVYVDTKLTINGVLKDFLKKYETRRYMQLVIYMQSNKVHKVILMSKFI